MKEHVYFLQMFPDYEPPEALKSALSQAAITAADIDPENRRVEVAIHSETYIPKLELDAAANSLRDSYGLKTLSITATHPASQLQYVTTQEIMHLFVEHNSMHRAALAGASFAWEGTTLKVKLLGNGVKGLQESVVFVCRNLQERFGTQISVEFEAGQALEGRALYEAMDRMRGEVLSNVSAGGRQEPRKMAAGQLDSAAFYGKPFKGPAVSMKGLNLDMGSIIVEGRVFSVEHKELKKRNAWVINFDMTDNFGSVRINRFMENNEAKPILENVKVGSVLRVQGKLTLNQFDNEMVLKPYAMMPGAMEKRKDLAVGDKRVELHLHTTMSNMDALTDTAEVVKPAAAWGHRAIAITDHGVCQSFPDAMKAAS